MKITFNVDCILPMIAQATNVVSSKNSLPILGCLMIETKGDVLLITASDGETWLSTKAPIIEHDEDFSVCINAVDFHKALTNLKGKNVSMTFDQEKHSVTCKHENGHFSLPYDATDDYPHPTKVDEEKAKIKKLSGADFLACLNKNSFAVAQDELRMIMNGVHFDFTTDCMVAVATDGYKLSKYTSLSEKADNEDGVFGFTLPKKPAAILANILLGYEGKIKMMFNDSTVTVNNTEFKLTTRLLEGRYPNYNAVIPQDNNIQVTVNKNDMVSALKRVLPMSNSQSELVSVNVKDNKITLTAIDIDFSKSASEFLECNTQGEEITIGFKGSALLNVLANIDCEQIKICLKAPSIAGLFTPAITTEDADYMALLMPLILQN